MKSYTQPLTFLVRWCTARACDRDESPRQAYLTPPTSSD